MGATPTLRFTAAIARVHGLTELRPGNYVYFDRTQVALESASLDDCALTVAAMVVSKPAPDRIILDCGSKMLTSDAARGFSATPGYGAVLTPDGRVTFIDWSSGDQGDPRHDVAIALRPDRGVVFTRSNIDAFFEGYGTGPVSPEICLWFQNLYRFF